MESDIQEKIRRALGPSSSRVLAETGIDPTITQAPSGKLVTWSDTMVEGVHFDLSYTTARELGHKALAVGLSRIAALGAASWYAQVTIGLKQENTDFFVTEFFRGMKQLAKPFRVDILATPPALSPTAVIVHTTVMGQVKRAWLTREGARSGDLIAVTGGLGKSAAGLACLKRLGRAALESDAPLYLPHLMPEPRVKEALALSASGTLSAMALLCDGLAVEMHRLTDLSSVGALVDENRLPVDHHTTTGAGMVDGDPSSWTRAWTLYGAEDFELLLTIKPAGLRKAEACLKRLGRSLAVIGEIKPRREGLKLQNKEGEVVPMAPRQWHHFVRRRRTAAAHS